MELWLKIPIEKLENLHVGAYSLGQALPVVVEGKYKQARRKTTWLP